MNPRILSVTMLLSIFMELLSINNNFSWQANRNLTAMKAIPHDG